MRDLRHLKRVALSLGLLLMMVTMGSLPEGRAPARPGPVVPRTKVGRLYERWVATHEAAGGDARVVLGLGPMKGVTAMAGGRGYAVIDLVHGTARVRAEGIEEGASAWLVDNRGGAGALPDGGDVFVALGEIQQGVAAGSFDPALDVDVVVIAMGHPLERLELVGMPTAFQRLYTKTRRAAPADAGGLVQSAHATVADADELTDPMVALGSDVFQNETFAGNGRTCGSCHPASNNFTIDPAFIALLPDDDPLFVAENNPALAELENPALLRGLGLIAENVDGFDNPAVFRSVPHTLALATSIAAPICLQEEGCFDPTSFTLIPEGGQIAFIDITVPAASGFDPVSPGVAFPVERTGWGGDGAPGSGTLREFSIGAVFQHFPLTLNRVPGVDFRLPTDEELDAMELFQLSLGRTEDLDLGSLTLLDAAAADGKTIFNTLDTQNGTVEAGKCALCHTNAGASITPEVFGALVAQFGLPHGIFGNTVLGTGVTDAGREDLVAPGVAPRDAGFGVLSLGFAECLQLQFDVSGPFPIPIFMPPGAEPGGFGGKGIAPLFIQDACLEQFNIPPLVEAADTGPFFHNNAFDTIEQAVEFYSSSTFNDVAAVQLFMAFTDSGRIGISITPSSSAKVARFLRVINAVENLREASEMITGSLDAATKLEADELVAQGTRQLDDATRVLTEVGLHPDAVEAIHAADTLAGVAITRPQGHPSRIALLTQAGARIAEAKALMVAE